MSRLVVAEAGVPAHVLREVRDMDAYAWEFYASQEGVDLSVRVVNETFLAALATAERRDDIRRAVHETMAAHASVGAFDTEPRAVLEGLIECYAGYLP